MLFKKTFNPYRTFLNRRCRIKYLSTIMLSPTLSHYRFLPRKGFLDFQSLGQNKNFIRFLWFGLSLVAALKEILANDINNYKIFKYTFINLTHFHSLYALQPAYYFDSNHYGPLFSFIIAPFTFLDDYTGCFFWVLFNAFVLYKAIMALPIGFNQRLCVLLISAHELMTASFSVQFNPIMTALILYTFIMVERKQDFWACFFISLGTLVKLYGIVGLVFFFFSKNKKVFIISFVSWFVFLFLLPMILSSSGFVIQTYQEWVSTLIFKNQMNISTGMMQDVSVMGMIRRISGHYQISNALIILPALFLYSLPIIIHYPNYTPAFKLSMLSSTLMFTVLFSTGSESPTYIIAVTGMAIWYSLRMRSPKPLEVSLLIFALIITSFSPSFLFPQWLNHHIIQKYSLKALPVFIIWAKITWDYIRFGFKRFEVKVLENSLVA